MSRIAEKVSTVKSTEVSRSRNVRRGKRESSAYRGEGTGKRKVNGRARKSQKAYYVKQTISVRVGCTSVDKIALAWERNQRNLTSILIDISNGIGYPTGIAGIAPGRKATMVRYKKRAP